jgi:hypothetical protein
MSSCGKEPIIDDVEANANSGSQEWRQLCLEFLHWDEENGWFTRGEIKTLDQNKLQWMKDSKEQMSDAMYKQKPSSRISELYCELFLIYLYSFRV